jgi:hypothetical protein
MLSIPSGKKEHSAPGWGTLPLLRLPDLLSKAPFASTDDVCPFSVGINANLIHAPTLIGFWSNCF